MLELDVDLHPITSDIWSAMFGLVVEPKPEAVDHAADERVVTGVVQITGDHEAAVTVQCSEPLARRATAAMFGAEEDELTDEEVSDCVGELANMTGGNVKSALFGTNQLSLPSVTVGRDYQVSVRGSRVTQRAGFTCEGHLLVVSLFQRNGGAS